MIYQKCPLWHGPIVISENMADQLLPILSVIPWSKQKKFRQLNSSETYRSGHTDGFWGFPRSIELQSVNKDR